MKREDSWKGEDVGRGRGARTRTAHGAPLFPTTDKYRSKMAIIDDFVLVPIFCRAAVKLQKKCYPRRPARLAQRAELCLLLRAKRATLLEISRCEAAGRKAARC